MHIKQLIGQWFLLVIDITKLSSNSHSHANLNLPLMEERNLKFHFPPVFIVVILMTMPTILVMVYHCIITGWCSRRQPIRLPQSSHQLSPREEQPPSSLDNSLIQLIPVYAITKEGVLISSGDEDSMCAVCLCEFKKGEEVRRLPECLHLFHLICIDMWLYSHSNCPLCRTAMNLQQPLRQGVP